MSDRGLWICLRLLITGAVLAGVTASGAAALADADPREEKRAIRSGDQALAQSLVITGADLSGFKTSGPAPKGKLACPPKFNPDLSGVVITGDVGGRQFFRRLGNNSEVFVSTAEVYASEAHARAEWQVYTSASRTNCARDTMETFASPGSITVTDNALRLRLPRVAPSQFARRYHVIWIVDNQVNSAYLDEIFLARGRAGVRVLVQRAGRPAKPPTASLERKLTQLLGNRLAAAVP
jgi:hypothetical protein